MAMLLKASILLPVLHSAHAQGDEGEVGTCAAGDTTCEVAASALLQRSAPKKRVASSPHLVAEANSRAKAPPKERVVLKQNKTVSSLKVKACTASNFVYYEDVFLDGMNDKWLYGVTLEQCRQACCDETDFVCKSFEYHPEQLDCVVLSEDQHDEHQTPTEWDHGWDYYEKSAIISTTPTTMTEAPMTTTPAAAATPVEAGPSDAAGGGAAETNNVYVGSNTDIYVGGGH